MIDWDRVDGLRDEIGEEAFADVVALFLRECDETVDGIAAHGAAGPEVRHFLKGAALNLGFDALARVCDDPASGADAGRLVSVYADTRAAFVARMAPVGV